MQSFNVSGIQVRENYFQRKHKLVAWTAIYGLLLHLEIPIYIKCFSKLDQVYWNKANILSS